MSSRGSRQQKTQRFNCPHCGERLWRVDGQKHYLVHTGAAENQENLDSSTTTANDVGSSGSFLDKNTWIEEFFCGEHGQIWLLVQRHKDGSLNSALAESPDWRKAT